MNELDLMRRFRDEVPVQSAESVERTVLMGIRGQAKTSAARRRALTLGRARIRPALAGALAVAVGAGAYAGVALSSGHGPGLQAAPRSIAWSGRPTAPWPASQPSFGRAKTEAQLIDYATRAAVVAARAPKPNEWIAVKTEFADSSKGSGGYIFGPVDERKISLAWFRGDECAAASVPNFPANLAPTRTVTGKLTIGDGYGAALGRVPCVHPSYAGWKSVSYSYLDSLPTDPAALEKIILQNNPPGGVIPTRESAIFDAISTLLTAAVQEGRAVVPPKLEAALYRVLQQLSGVHFESAVDLAGRTGLGFYMVREGYDKEEIVIDPLTYAYMGFEDVAIKDHAMTGTDGTRFVEKGHVMGWAALLGSAIVQRPGQLP